MGDPRITFNSVNIDLVMGRTGLISTPVQKRERNDSSTGKIEIINLYGQWEYSFDAYFSRAVYYDLLAWWSWARQGKTWSFALDSAKVGNTTLDGSAASGQKVIPLTATAAFSTGDICLIKAEDADDEFELIEIDSISAGVSVTAVDNLIYSYQSTDTFRHKDYLPTVVTLSNKWEPKYTGVSDVTKKYFKHSFRFIESL